MLLVLDLLVIFSATFLQNILYTNAGSVIIGTAGSIVIPHVAPPKLFPEDKFPADSLPTLESLDHYVQWADAARGVGKTTDHFDYAVPLTEAVLLGTVAVRTPGTTLLWDSEKLTITNSEAANAMLNKPYRKGWEPKWLS